MPPGGRQQGHDQERIANPTHHRLDSNPYGDNFKVELTTGRRTEWHLLTGWPGHFDGNASEFASAGTGSSVGLASFICSLN
jgi:hypothetical protein